MKSIREIITDLNVARSNDCSKEKSEEIKGIIQYLLQYEKVLDIMKSKDVDIVALKYFINVDGYNYSLRGKSPKLTQQEWELLREVFVCH